MKEGQGRKGIKGREESRQRGFFFAGDVALQEQRGKQCIFTDEIKLWPKEGERLDRERGEDYGLFLFSFLFYM